MPVGACAQLRANLRAESAGKIERALVSEVLSHDEVLV